MNPFRISLGILYFLLVVVLPWLHMPWHGQKTEKVNQAQTCGHHDHHDEREPRAADDCGLCDLAVLPVAQPGTLTVPAALYVLSAGWQSEYDFIHAQIQRPHQARAPPFMTA